MLLRLSEGLGITGPGAEGEAGGHYRGQRRQGRMQTRLALCPTTHQKTGSWPKAGTRDQTGHRGPTPSRLRRTKEDLIRAAIETAASCLEDRCTPRLETKYCSAEPFERLYRALRRSARAIAVWCAQGMSTRQVQPCQRRVGAEKLWCGPWWNVVTLLALWTDRFPCAKSAHPSKACQTRMQ